MAGLIMDSTIIIKTAEWCEWLPVSVIQRGLMKKSANKRSNFRAK
jgi:hypothetical protein